MNIWPERRNGVSRRLSAIRTDVEKLGDDVRGLLDDVADVAMTSTGRVVHPVAQGLNKVSGRLNGNSNRQFMRTSLGQAAVIAASVGTVALIGGIIATRR